MIISETNINNNADTSYSISFNPNGEIVDVSQSIEKILEYKPEELIGSKIYKISLSLTEGFFKTILKDIAKSKSILRVEVEHKSKKGKKLKLHASIKFVDDKSGGLYFGFYELNNFDVNNRQKLPAESKTSACDVVSEFNLHGICTYIDDKVQKFTGYDAIEFIGQSMFAHMPKSVVKMAKEHLKYFVPRRQSFRVSSNQIICSDGKILDFESCYIPKYNDLGIFTGYSALNWLKSSKKIDK